MGLGVQDNYSAPTGRGFEPTSTSRSWSLSCVATLRPTASSAARIRAMSAPRPDTSTSAVKTGASIRRLVPMMFRPARWNASRTWFPSDRASGSFAAANVSVSGWADSDRVSSVICAGVSSRHARCCLIRSVSKRASAASFSSCAARSFAAAALSFAVAALAAAPCVAAETRWVSVAANACTRAVTRDAMSEDAKDAITVRPPRMNAASSVQSATLDQNSTDAPHIPSPPAWLYLVGAGLWVSGIAGHCWLILTRRPRCANGQGLGPPMREGSS